MPPKMAGMIWIVPKRYGANGVGFGVVNKPNAFNRLMMRLLLGWVWEDEGSGG